MTDSSHALSTAGVLMIASPMAVPSTNGSSVACTIPVTATTDSAISPEVMITPIPVFHFNVVPFNCRVTSVSQFLEMGLSNLAG